MGLSQALWTGLTSLQAHQTWTDVIGQNISQVNTTGYKYSDVAFTDLLYGTMNPGDQETSGRGSINPSQKGLGAQVGSISQVFTNGNLQQTNQTFDCAIDGNGFFVLRGSNNSDNYYTRNGSFYLSSPLASNPLTQNLQSASGLTVQGYQGTDGVLADSLSDITLPSLSTVLPGEATTELAFNGNLNSTAPVTTGNGIATVQEGVTTGGWISDTGSAINVGGVETSAPLLSHSSSGAASGSTDLADLDFLRGNTPISLFGSVPAGYTVNSRELTIDFKKGDTNYSEIFIYGEDGTTLDDFTRWLTGGVGDSGTADTQRLDGGALGTIRTQEYTEAEHGYAAPAEQAGGYYGYDTEGNFSLSLASNLGIFNTISDIQISTNTVLTDTSGTTHNNLTSFNDIFEPNPHYTEDNQGASSISSTDIFLESGSTEGTLEEKERINYTLISRDSEGSTWRWYADGDFESVDDAKLNKGTGIIRFGTTNKTGEQQVKDATVDGGTSYTFDFSKMTQVALDNSVTVTQDGYADGELSGYTIDQYGVIDGTYTNGHTQHLAKLGMAVVQNNNGMLQIGDTLWSTSEISGSTLFNSTENQDIFGTLRSNYLESSNVDMANEMSKLIMSQRGYQLGSKIITTADDMLKEAADLKR